MNIMNYEVFAFVEKHKLEKNISYHGFVSGEAKRKLFQDAHMLVYPSKNDAFPLTLLESLSFGVPVLSTNEGSITYILDKKSGIVIKDLNELEKAFVIAVDTLANRETAQYCRKRYLDNFSIEQFENNLVELFK